MISTIDPSRMMQNKAAKLCKTLKAMGIAAGEEEIASEAMIALWLGSAKYIYDNPEDQFDYLSRINVTSQAEVSETVDTMFLRGMAPPLPEIYRLHSRESAGAEYYQTAYHGSSYEFDQFSLAAHGSGEGSAAYGWGAYFSENPKVAQWFRGKFSNQGARGQVYEADIPDVDGMLIWDSPVESQSGPVKNALEDLLPSVDSARHIVASNDGSGAGIDFALARFVVDREHAKVGGWYATGGYLYHRLSLALGGDLQASLFLRQHGVKGIQYQDLFSRAENKGSLNFVVFDEADIALRRTLFQYAGPGAKSAIQDTLVQAWDLERDGVDNEEIRQRTGWFRGMDRKWRFEIDDSKSRIAPWVTSTGLKVSEVFEKYEDTYADSPLLGEFLEHEQLFRAYPFLEHRPLYPIQEGGVRTSSGLGIGTRTSAGNYVSDDLFFKIIHHEVQHEIQTYEGFASGASLESDSVVSQSDLLWKQNHDRLLELCREYPDAGRVFRERNQCRISLIDRYGKNWQEKALQNHLDEYNDLELRLRALKGGEEILETDFICAYFASDDGQQQSRLYAYMNHAGEIEARDTESRLKFSSEMRKMLPPVLRSDAIVVIGDRAYSYAISPESVGSVVKNYLSYENSKALELQARKILSPAFKAWFGDWESNIEQSSKVLDKNGLPLVVYRGEHGPSNKDVSSRVGSVTFGSRDAACTYAMHPNFHDDQPIAPRIYPAYLNIRNPFILQEEDPFIEMGVFADAFGIAKAWEIARKFEQEIKNTNNWEEEFSSTYQGLSELQELEPERIRDLYFDAYRAFDDPEIIAFLKDAGFDGAVHGGNGETAFEAEYRVFDPSQVKSVYFQGQRGSLTLSAAGSYLMRLNNSADKSTPLHESAHIFLEEMAKSVRDGKASHQCRQDFYKTMDWLGVKSDGVITRSQHEKFARGFEAFLFKRKSPSSCENRGIVGMFNLFRDWLRDVYFDYSNFKVDVDPEMERIYERIIATSSSGFDSCMRSEFYEEPCF